MIHKISGQNFFFYKIIKEESVISNLAIIYKSTRTRSTYRERERGAEESSGRWASRLCQLKTAPCVGSTVFEREENGREFRARSK
jgi:hypothetical protein